MIDCIENDDGSITYLTDSQKRKLAEDGFEIYLAILKMAKVSLSESLTEERKRRWMKHYDI